MGFLFITYSSNSLHIITFWSLISNWFKLYTPNKSKPFFGGMAPCSTILKKDPIFKIKLLSRYQENACFWSLFCFGPSSLNDSSINLQNQYKLWDVEYYGALSKTSISYYQSFIVKFYEMLIFALNSKKRWGQNPPKIITKLPTVVWNLFIKFY